MAHHHITFRPDGSLRVYFNEADVLSVPYSVRVRAYESQGKYPEDLALTDSGQREVEWIKAQTALSVPPEVTEALDRSVSTVKMLSVPIMPPTDTELMAFCHGMELTAIKSLPEVGIEVTVGEKYKVEGINYDFTEKFKRRKPVWDADTCQMVMEDQECIRTGQNMAVRFFDDENHRIRFIDHKQFKHDFDESLCWGIFERPNLDTVKERFADAFKTAMDTLSTHELLAGFTYYPGQKEYVARNSIKDFGLISAETGCGKTLVAIALAVLKQVDRCLIIAPKGTVKGEGKTQGDEGDYDPAQWERELHHFAPSYPVYRIFTQKDYETILNKHNGVLPKGFFITYADSYLTNGCLERLPEKMSETVFRARAGVKSTDNATRFSDGVGTTMNGIRCIAKPSMATLTVGMFDMVILDECHLMQNLDTIRTQEFLRVQAKYRYALSATPIPNIVTDMFPILGWLSVPDWYKGYRRNAAFPYTAEDLNRFAKEYLATERNLTVERLKRMTGNRNARCTTRSPIVSAPSRLLKLLKPTLSYISKKQCNPFLVPCEIIDVRVPFGKQQENAYAYYTNRKNIPTGSALTAAMAQHTYLRGVCADPATCSFSRHMVESNFNPKLIAGLELTLGCLRKGEQVVIVASRLGQLDEIEQRLGEAGILCSRIDSTRTHHSYEAQTFKQGHTKVMLMGIKMAQAFSFENCPNLIVLSLEWNYAAKNQAMGRVYRLNSPKPVKVWCVLNENSVEEVMFDKVASKADAATLCLQGQRVPQASQIVDASEIVAEHLINYTTSGRIVDETICEAQWPALKQQLEKHGI